MPKIVSLLPALALPMLLLVPAPRALAAPKTVEEIEACMEANMPGDSSIQEITMTTFDRVGDTTTMRSKIFWQKGKGDRSKVLMRFDDPVDLRGSAILVLEKKGRNDMFMYVPELQKVRRITSHMMSGSMFGTDFSYEEFERLQGMGDNATSERGPDQEVAGRPVWTLDQVPAEDAGSDYEKIRSLVDQETCVAVQIEFFGKGDEVAKRMEAPFDKVTKEGKGHVPREITMNDSVEGTKTTLVVNEIEVDADIPARMFSQSQLERGSR